MPSLPPGSPPPERARPPRPPEGRRVIDYLSPAVLASLTPQAREALSHVPLSYAPNVTDIFGQFMGQPLPAGSFDRFLGGVYVNRDMPDDYRPEVALHEGLHAIHARPPEFSGVYNRSRADLEPQFNAIYGRTEDYVSNPITAAVENFRRSVNGPEEAFAAFGQAMNRGQVPPWQVRWLYRDVFTPEALRGPRTRVAGQMGARDIARRNEQRGYAISLPTPKTLVPRPPTARME